MVSVSKALKSFYTKQTSFKPQSIFDTADNIAANLDDLNKMALAGKIASIGFSSSSTLLRISSSQYFNDTAILAILPSNYTLSISGVPAFKAKIIATNTHVVSFVVSDTAANITTNIADLIASGAKLASIVETGIISPVALTASQYSAGITAKFSNFTATVSDVLAANAIIVVGNAKVTSIAVSDTAAQLSGYLNTLQDLDKKLTAITNVDNQVLNISVDQLARDAAALAKINGGVYKLNVTAVPIAGIAAVEANPHVVGILVADTAVKIQVSDNLNTLIHLGSKLLAITEVGVGVGTTIALTASQYTPSFTAKFTNFSASVSGVLAGDAALVATDSKVSSMMIVDSAANIAANIDQLQAHISLIDSILLSDPQNSLHITGTQSVEAEPILSRIDGPFNLYIQGSANNGILLGQHGHDVLAGGSADEIFKGQSGDDLIDGGAGADIATYLGLAAEYNISYDSAKHLYTVTDLINNRNHSGQSDGVDTLANVEYLTFDGDLSQTALSVTVANLATVLANPNIDSVYVLDTAEHIAAGIGALEANYLSIRSISVLDSSNPIVLRSSDLNTAAHAIDLLSGDFTLVTKVLDAPELEVAPFGSDNTPYAFIRFSNNGLNAAEVGDIVQLFDSDTPVSQEITLSATDISRGYLVTSTAELSIGSHHLVAKLSDQFGNVASSAVDIEITKPVGLHDTPLQVGANPNYDCSEAMLASMFAGMAYDHRALNFGSMLSATGWTGISIGDSVAGASVAGYGVDVPGTMQSYALAARRTAADGTEQFVISFEGSNSPFQEMADWVVNAKQYGWSSYYQSLMPIMTETIQQMLEAKYDQGKDVELIISGHSLGGAAASMAYADLFVQSGDLWPDPNAPLSASNRIYAQSGLDQWSDDEIRALLPDVNVYTIGAPSFLIEPSKLNESTAVALGSTIAAATITMGPVVGLTTAVATLVVAGVSSLMVNESNLPNLLDFSSHVFQFEHQNTTWYLPGDTVANLGNLDAGTVLNINLDNDIQYKYTGDLLYLVPAGTHGGGNYIESIARLVSDNPVLKSPNELSATAPLFNAVSAVEGTDNNDLFRNIDNASGYVGNDLFVYSNTGASKLVFKVNGGSEDDTYVLKNLNIDVTIESLSGLDTLIFDVKGSISREQIDADADGVIDDIRYILSNNGADSTVTVIDGQKLSFNHLIQMNENVDTNWTLSYLNPLTGEAYPQIGGAGADLFTGTYNGNNFFTGGAGIDTFCIGTAGSKEMDSILDFVSGEDILQFSKVNFAALGNVGALSDQLFYAAADAISAQSAAQRLVYNTTSGALYYDADGAGGTAAVQVALLGQESHPMIANTDIQIVA